MFHEYCKQNDYKNLLCRVMAQIVTRAELWHFPLFLLNCSDVLLNFSSIRYRQIVCIEYMKGWVAYLNSLRANGKVSQFDTCHNSSHYPIYLILKNKPNVSWENVKWENTNVCRCFLWKFYFLTGVTLKLYQKLNCSPKNNLRKYFAKNRKIIAFG